MKLDNIDLKILEELEKDARKPLTEIAKALRTSQQNISYHLSILEKNSIIKQYYTVINLRKLGYTVYRTLFRLSNINQQKHKEIINFLMKYENVLWLVDVGGRADLLVNFVAKDVFDYSRLLDRFKNKFAKQIQNYEVLTIVELHYVGRSYLSNQKQDNFLVNKDGKKYELDSLDTKILNLLSEDARINAADIAYQLKVSPNTIVLRIKKLKENGVIINFKPLIDLSKLNYSDHKALIKFQNITDEKEKELIDFLKNEACVIGAIKLMGSWDFEIEFEVKNRLELRDFIGRVRDKFSNIIKEFELLDLFQEYKYNFFPKDLLEMDKVQK